MAVLPAVALQHGCSQLTNMAWVCSLWSLGNSPEEEASGQSVNAFFERYQHGP
jgi:hypothetical protein